MAQKHLHELLKEDQEPFYITNKRFQLKRLNFSSPKTSSLQINKIQKPINQTPTFEFCKNICFSTFGESPELRRSPLCLPSPPAMKKSSENGKCALHVPARTATLLLEAAMRIQKQQSSSKSRAQVKKVKFGIFGSILTRLKDRDSTESQKEMLSKVAYDGFLESKSSMKSAHNERFNVLDCTFFKDQKGTLVEMLNKTSCNTPSCSDSSHAHRKRFNASDRTLFKDRKGTLAEMLNKSACNTPSWSDSSHAHSERFNVLDCTFFENRKDTLTEMLNKTASNTPSWSDSSHAHSERFNASNCSFFKDRKSTLAEMLNKTACNTLSWSDPFLEIVHDENFSASDCDFFKDQNGNKKGEIKNGEDKLMDLETFSNNGDFGSCSFSPFRFSLQRSSSSGADVVPVFTSPAASPVCHKKEEKENYETIALESIDQLEEDEKEQCSPVSVLDPPFKEEDDHDRQEYEEEEEEEDEDYDLDCSYALVQRAQQQLLYKLRRFEKLAELDPIELEKLILEEEEREEEDNEDRVEEKEYQVSNLNSVENSEVKSLNYGEAIFGRECKRLDSYSGPLTKINASEVSYRSQELRLSNTIEMMIKSDLKSELNGWNKFQEQREETAIEFAFYISGLLVEELGEELIQISSLS